MLSLPPLKESAHDNSTAMITLYGIPNCDTVKKARKWLEAEGLEYLFHDFKKQGLDEHKINQWLSSVGPDLLVNKRSTSWKKLTDAEKALVAEGGTAQILSEYPTLVKRPVLETENSTHVGFKAEQYQSIFS